MKFKASKTGTAGLFSFFWRRVDVQTNTFPKMSITPQAIQQLLDELEASRASRKRAWENLQEIRWILNLKDATGINLPGACQKND
jgi:hypothetical protein